MDTLTHSDIESLKKLAEGVIAVTARMDRVGEDDYIGPIVFQVPTLSEKLARKLLLLVNQYENLLLDRDVQDSELSI